MDSRLKRNSEEVFEYLGGCPVAKDLSRAVVVLAHDDLDSVCWNGLEICGAGQVAAHASDGIFDAALLPGPMWITEVGRQGELLCEAVMAGKFAAIVEGNGFQNLIALVDFYVVSSFPVSGQVGPKCMNVTKYPVEPGRKVLGYSGPENRREKA